MSRTKRNLIPLLLVMAALAGLLMTTAFAEGDAEYVSSFFAQPLSLLPPVLAIALALITKEVYTSLFLGCLVGGFLYANFNPVVAVTSVYDTIASKVGDNMGIVVFLVSLGFIVVLMNRSGGSKAYGDWAKKVIKTRRGALLATMILALVLGVDDYFNNLTTGNVMRPVTDGHQISRAKLAYMIDSTAAPVCIMMPISSWAAAVSGVAESMEGVSGLQLFISAIPWNYYAILTIFTLIVLAVFDEDFGPMKVHEDNAKRGDIYTTPERPFEGADDESKNSTNGKVIDLVIPVIVLIVSCVSGLLFTGGFFSPDSDYFMDVLGAFADCSAADGLMYGSFIVVIFCFIYFLLLRRSMSFVQVTDCIAEGFKVMVPAILILTFAWTISGVTNDLLGAKFFVEHFMQAYAKDLDAQLETIGVEFNTKLQEFQQSADTLGDAMKQLKEKELNDLQTRYQEFQQMAGSDMQKKQVELLQPIQEKCLNAISEVAKAGGYIVIFDLAAGSLAYIDEAATTDISPEVKTKLGIQ